jgi:hypothetical protein
VLGSQLHGKAAAGNRGERGRRTEVVGYYLLAASAGPKSTRPRPLLLRQKR